MIIFLLVGYTTSFTPAFRPLIFFGKIKQPFLLCDTYLQFLIPKSCRPIVAKNVTIILSFKWIYLLVTCAFLINKVWIKLKNLSYIYNRSNAVNSFRQQD